MDKLTKIQTIVRVVITLILIYFAFKETGIVTAFLFLALSAFCEVQTWQTGQLLQLIARIAKLITRITKIQTGESISQEKLKELKKEFGLDH